MVNGAGMTSTGWSVSQMQLYVVLVDKPKGASTVHTGDVERIHVEFYMSKVSFYISCVAGDM